MLPEKLSSVTFFQPIGKNDIDSIKVSRWEVESLKHEQEQSVGILGDTEHVSNSFFFAMSQTKKGISGASFCHATIIVIYLTRVLRVIAARLVLSRS